MFSSWARDGPAAGRAALLPAVRLYPLSPQPQANLEGLLQRGGAFGHMPHRGEGALEAGQRLAIGGALDSHDPGPVEMKNGSVPALALDTMQTQSEVVGFQVVRMQYGQRVSHASAPDRIAPQS